MKSRILIVDDQDYNRAILHDMMIILDHEPFLAENGRIALRMLSEIHPDLMILDIMMPEMGGFEVLEKMKERADPEYVPVIIVSALDDVDSIARGIQLGAEDFLTKPFNTTILKTRVSSCIAKKRLHDFERARTQKLESELDEVRTQLLHSDRLSGIGQVSASVAHDVNNKIAAVLNRVAMMLRKADSLDERQQINLQKIDEICRGSAKLLRKLLDYSRSQKTDLEALDVHTPIENALALVEHKVTTSGIEIDYRKHAEPLFLEGNSEQLEQVFMNLLINAGDAMEAGGHLTITVSDSSGRETDVADPDYIRIDCQDTGCGIPADLQQKIFEPFFTTKPKGKGTGLGMYIIREVVELHRGKICIESSVGIGTTITLLLPRIPMGPIL